MTIANTQRPVTQVPRLLTGPLALMALGWALLAVSWAQAQNYSVLYSFQCEPSDGAYPYGNLIADSAGNLYGTTINGGSLNFGTVFELSAGGTETILHNFLGSPVDGAWPYAGLVRDDLGNFYGTTYYGGAFDAVDGGEGTVFEVPASGAESVLHSFGQSASDGTLPMSTLLRDGAGNLYGTTSNAVSERGGIVFKVSGTGKETVLYAFGGSSGESPLAGLIHDTAGNLYGTTSEGGSGAGNGTVFELAKAGQEAVLHDFGGSPSDGAGPAGPLLRDSAGNLYGTTLYGGREVTCVGNATGCGTVFRVAPDGTETVLLSFEGQAGGGVPYGNLVEDKNGNLYGTASLGGSFTCSRIGCGVVFELSAAGKERMLHQFAGPPTDGEEPLAGLLQVGDALYGTTTQGGANGCGTVYQVTP